MIIKNKRSSPPRWNATIWRYLSLEKFLDMILNDQLFFVNAGRLTDKNEGTFSDLTIERLMKKSQELGKSTDEAEQEVESLQMEIDLRKRYSYLNCWTIDHDESYALWKIYLGGSKSGVAIKTNVKRLVESLDDKTSQQDIFLEKIDYQEYIKGPVDLLAALTTKRKCYKYENELRLIIFRDPPSLSAGVKRLTRGGIRIKINPEKLIDEIYLSPFAGYSFTSVFKQTLERLAPNYLTKLKESEINDQ
jgi:hypothetical protein